MDASGALWAPTEEAARHQLAVRHLWPLALRAEVNARGTRRAPSRADLAVGLRVLASLVGAELPLSRTLEVFRETATDGWDPSAIEEVADQVRQGVPFAQALGHSIDGFPPHALAIIGASASAGSLAAGCRLAASDLEDSAAARNAVGAALAYPAMLALAGAIALIILVGIVLPRFAGLLGEHGQDPPLTTRVVLATAAALKAVALPTFVLACIAAVCFALLRRAHPEADRWLADGLLRVPLIGDLVFALATARMAGTLASLMRAGVPLPQALAHASAVAGNAVVSQRLSEVALRVQAGERLSRSLALASAAPPVLVRLAQAGEESGDLSGMLGFGAELVRARTQQRITRLVRFLEPALILAFGALIGVVAAAMLQAIYAVRPT